MTCAPLALRLLKYLGVTSLDPTVNANNTNQRGLVDGDLDDVAACITAALQEVFTEGPSAISETRFASVLPAPLAVTFTATQFSATISAFSGYQSWMAGCTVQINGDDSDNEIVSATALLRPYIGGSGAVSGQVLGDAVLLPATLQNVMDPVRCSGITRELSSASSREEFEYWSHPHHCTHRWPGGVGYSTMYRKRVADPLTWLCEAQYTGTAGTLPIFLRVNPAPQRAQTITCRAKRRPQTILQADITADTAIILDNAESILLPFALQRWTAHPLFGGSAGTLAEIARQYKEAKSQLAALVPQISPTQGNYR